MVPPGEQVAAGGCPGLCEWRVVGSGVKPLESGLTSAIRKQIALYSERIARRKIPIRPEPAVNPRPSIEAAGPRRQIRIGGPGVLGERPVSACTGGHPAAVAQHILRIRIGTHGCGGEPALRGFGTLGDDVDYAIYGVRSEERRVGKE